MAEQALYRKYRSQSFDEVVGQPHVVQTLTNALAAGRVSHAYLFTGPRGVGKTSVARLLAMAVNCLGDKVRPCGSCAMCVVPLPSNMDVIEIDAASNRRIDEMRDLREKVNIAPTAGKYKVYIVDEVHMLTTEAFNALLKTLEEPPAHVIFILATTEAHKVPETIISRTQRFNFKPISMDDLVQHLGAIAQKEGVTIDEGALTLLAQVSRGGFRDAISMLDQVSSSAGEAVSAATVRLLLGWGDQETLAAISQGIAATQPAQSLAALDKAMTGGAQATQLIAQLIEYWRQIMLAAVGSPAELDAAQTKLAQELTPNQIVEIVRTLAELNKSALPELSLESAIIRLALQQTAPTVAVPKPQPAVASAAPVITHTRPVVRREATAAEPTPKTIEPAPAGDAWNKALVLIKEQNNSLYALLCSCKTNLADHELVLTCRFSFHRDRLQESKNRQVIEAALAKAYGRPIQLVCQLENTPKAEKPADRSAELVSSALEILGGEVVDA